MESFYSLQGEGLNSGRAAYFIRLAGCKIGCPFCDVKEAWNMNAWPQRSVSDLVKEVKQIGAKMVVITGGEPLLHNLDELCMTLRHMGCELSLETSGSEKRTGQWDWICISPKKQALPLNENYLRANELKVIIENENDLEWAESLAPKVNKNCALLLQAEWSKRAEVTPMIIEYIKQHPQWRLSIQMHKYTNIP